MNISIVIPVFNGRELLERYLPSVLAACGNYHAGETEVVVVDDAGSDGTAEVLGASFPVVRVVRHRDNRGFAATANDGILSCRYRTVFLVNNDVEVAPDFFKSVPPVFDDPDVFALRPGLTDTAGGDAITEPRTGGRFRRGRFDVQLPAACRDRFAFFAGGGAAVFDRSKFLELGGFDEMFSPFYSEDVDLSYRAWRRGWKIIYEPRCLAWHRGGATIKKYHKNDYVARTAERNGFLLVWKNIADPWLLLNHFVFTPFRLAYSCLKGDLSPLRGFFLALGLLPEVMERRRFEKLMVKKSDRAVFGLFKA